MWRREAETARTRPVAKGVLGPGFLDDRHAFFKHPPVEQVGGLFFIPVADRLDARPGGIVLDPARLIAAHEGDVEPALQHMIHHGHILGHPQRVVGVEHIAQHVNAQPLGMLADEHAQQARAAGRLHTLDLQVMLGMAEAGKAGLVTQPDVVLEIVQHALVQGRIFPGHAGFQLRAGADRPVGNSVKFHRAPFDSARRPSEAW